MDGEDSRAELPTGPSQVDAPDQPFASADVSTNAAAWTPVEPPIEPSPRSVESFEQPVPAVAPAAPDPIGDIPLDAERDPSSDIPIAAMSPLDMTLAAIQFKADGGDLGPALVTAAPAIIRSHVGDLPVGVIVPALAVTLGLGLVLLGAILPTSQSSARLSLLAIESVSNGTTPAAGFWFAIAAIGAGFVGQLIAYPILARRGRRWIWTLALLGIGVAEAAGFAVARSSGGSISGEPLTALPPMLGIAGGVLTAVAGLLLGFVGSARDGVKCRECRAVLTRETGFCPDCGAWLTEVIPTRSRLARGWHSGLVRGALGVLAVCLPVVVTVLLIVITAPLA
jgi:MFS family permease